MSYASHPLAPYACQPGESRGRLHAEGECPMRTPHQRDRDRIIHCTAFRRLEYKTQVFVNHEGDHYRTRLTHTLEVAQLSRSMARCLRLNEDLAEALALAHDLGHPPFGHAGEDALHASMQDYGGFDHNAHTIHILTHLEQRYAAFDGLNLSWETLEGIAKHNGPLVGKDTADLPRALVHYNQQHNLQLDSYASAEAQIAAIADDIAYNNHDLDDGLRAGLFTLDDLANLPLLGDLVAQVKQAYPDISAQRYAHEVTRKLIGHMVQDVLDQTQKIIDALDIKSADDVRRLGKKLVCFSPEMEQTHQAIKAYLFTHMYRHFRVNRMTTKARRIVQELFDYFMAEPQCLPPIWFAQTQDEDRAQRAKVIADFIAGMTDRFAIDEYTRIFDPNART
jgi:dGTPase